MIPRHLAPLLKTAAANYHNRGREPDLYFWRDSRGNEIDLVVDLGQRLLPIEIKSGETVVEDFFQRAGALAPSYREGRSAGRSESMAASVRIASAASRCTRGISGGSTTRRFSHERMPVILEPHAYGRWLGTDITDAEGLTQLLVPFPPENMKAYPVDTWVNNPQNEGAACRKPTSIRVGRRDPSACLDPLLTLVRPRVFSRVDERGWPAIEPPGNGGW